MWNCKSPWRARLTLSPRRKRWNPFCGLRDDLDRLSYGYYFAELVDRFVEEEMSTAKCMSLMLDALHWLIATKHLSRTARFFEMQLLDVLGYRPQLNVCIQSKEELLPEENFFSPGAGGMLKPQYREMYRDSISVPVNALKVLRYLQNRNFSQIEQLQFVAAGRSRSRSHFALLRDAPVGTQSEIGRLFEHAQAQRCSDAA